MYRLPGGDAQPAGQAPPPTFLATPDPGRWTWGRGEDPLGTALAEVGLAVGDLRLAVVSHLHGDHAGGIGTLARAGVPWRHTSTRSPPPDPGHPRSHPGPRVAAGGPARDGHAALPRRAAEPAQDVVDVAPAGRPPAAGRAGGGVAAPAGRPRRGDAGTDRLRPRPGRHARGRSPARRAPLTAVAGQGPPTRARGPAAALASEADAGRRRPGAHPRESP